MGVLALGVASVGVLPLGLVTRFCASGFRTTSRVQPAMPR